MEINLDQLKYFMYYHMIIVESLFKINLSLFVTINCGHVALLIFKV